MYESNKLSSEWEYTHKGFPPTPFHPILGPSAEGPEGGAWGGWGGGESLMGILPYWTLDIYLFLHTHICQTNATK